MRFVQCTHSYKWDQHGNLEAAHRNNAREVDTGIAGLIKDLKSRGMLDETLVLWGGEFGRTPVAQDGNGRDHNPHGFTMWMAGGGVKPGFSFGETDEYGFYAVEDKVHVHDLHATMLALLGIDHERLTYRDAGRDFGPRGQRDLRLIGGGGSRHIGGTVTAAVRTTMPPGASTQRPSMRSGWPVALSTMPPAARTTAAPAAWSQLFSR